MAAPRSKPRRKPRLRPSTRVSEEIARFEANAGDWWNAAGAFAPLHRLNPVRIAFIRDAVRARFARGPESSRPLAGLDLLDVGCGGGLLCEPMARLGARVTGIDAGADNIRVAAAHARASKLAIAYRAATPEDLARERARFDVILNMEVIEHVADAGAFVETCAALVRPGGIMVLATLNRTLKSLLLGKVAAEYVLRWIPPGTHDWRKFVPPADLAAMLARAGMSAGKTAGVVFDPWRGEWRLDTGDLAVNYMMVAAKDARRRKKSRRSRA
ncbi:MAG: bifunctional 2-polyprenyl-6-hydroxyphenol methylase/3-demethylubiquinol 3-O-methyltransferase UbiG [Rhodospirillales bacterium]|nr:bifunctional 2-polyprenyl-6-hydroxyphenol methylase/3-demethylubiquinol 3-O-methyltransferase UbiG [Rhodospirillales bacterium]